MAGRRTWPLWLAGLALKLVASTWDVSWHFKLLFDTWSPAHLTSAVGFVLIASAFLLDWRRRSPRDQAGLNVAAAGFGLFLLAIPLDQAWHRVFGLDLTTWSPTHLLLFSGTAATVVGVVLLALADLGWDGSVPVLGLRPGPRGWLLLLALGVFLVDAVGFPLGFQEHAAVAWWNHGHGDVLYTPDPAIERLTVQVRDAAHGNLPPVLYPTYAVALTVLVVVLVRRVSGAPGFATLVMVAFAAQRALANVVLARFGWPPAVVPWHVVVVALAVDVVLLVRPASRLRGFAAGLAAAALATLEWQVQARFPPALPADLDVAPWTFAAAAVGWALAEAVLHTPTPWIRFVRLDRAPYLRHLAARLRAVAGGHRG